MYRNQASCCMLAVVRHTFRLHLSPGPSVVVFAQVLDDVLVSARGDETPITVANLRTCTDGITKSCVVMEKNHLTAMRLGSGAGAFAQHQSLFLSDTVCAPLQSKKPQQMMMRALVHPTFELLPPSAGRQASTSACPLRPRRPPPSPADTACRSKRAKTRALSAWMQHEHRIVCRMPC